MLRGITMANPLFLSPDPLWLEVSPRFEHELVEEARRSQLFPLSPSDPASVHDIVAAYMGG
jgi:hypothetical protein